MSDADLVERARQGDSAAFGELVDRHRAAVFRAALAALGSRADAEDAAQEAFLMAYRRLGSFRGEASFKTWLLTIAWHQGINRRRSLSRWWRHTVAIEPDEEAGYVVSGFSRTLSSRTLSSRTLSSRTLSGRTTSPNPEQAASDQQLRRDIRREIRALTPKLRDALLLVQAGEYSYEEIAAMLKAPLGTIKWRISEARRVVKRRLRERGYGDVG